jgi:hypothetical protein
MLNENPDLFDLANRANSSVLSEVMSKCVKCGATFVVEVLDQHFNVDKLGSKFVKTVKKELKEESKLEAGPVVGKDYDVEIKPEVAPIVEG